MQRGVVGSAAFQDAEALGLAGGTTGHRGWNRQPAGMSLRVGRLAGEDLLLDLSVSGTTESSAFVYGCCGCSRTCSVGPELDDAAEVHHRDPIGDVPREAEIVRDNQDRDAAFRRRGRA